MAWESYAELVATKPFSSLVPWERAALASQTAERSCWSWQTERRSRQTVGQSRQNQSPAHAREGQNCVYMNGGFDCDWWSLHSHTAARNRTVECLHTDTAVSNRERKGERRSYVLGHYLAGISSVDRLDRLDLIIRVFQPSPHPSLGLQTAMV